MNKPFLSGKVLVKDVRQSYVYAVGVLSDQTSVVKFGYTKALEDRLRAIQTGSPVKLHVIASSFGAKREETAIHKHLAGDRLYGEWFTRSERAIRVIEAMQRNGIAEMFGLASAKNPALKAPLHVIGGPPMPEVT